MFLNKGLRLISKLYNLMMDADQLRNVYMPAGQSSINELILFMQDVAIKKSRDSLNKLL